MAKKNRRNIHKKNVQEHPNPEMVSEEHIEEIGAMSDSQENEDDMASEWNEMNEVTEDSVEMATEEVLQETTEPETEETPEEVAEPEAEEVPEEPAEPETEETPEEVAEPEAEEVPEEPAELEMEEVSEEVAELETEEVPEEPAELETEEVPEEAVEIEMEGIPENGEESLEEGILEEAEAKDTTTVPPMMNASMPVRTNRFRLFNFSRKLMLLCLVPMIIVSVAIISISSKALTNKIEAQIEEALQIVTCSLEETYNNLYKGDYSQDKSGSLSKGDTQISGDTVLLDALKEQTGYESSFIYEDMRRITTVKRKAGGRIQGTNVDEKVYKKVMEGKSVFRTDIVIQETEYYAYYQPLYNSDGSVCGMVGSAKPAAEVQKMIQKAQRDVIQISVVIMIISMLLVLVVTGRMSKAMKKTKSYLQIIANGDLTAVSDDKLLRRKDELGDIYYMSVQLQQELKKIVTNIKESVEHLSESADGLTGMAQGTRMTVDEVYDSVEIISQGANTQAEHTSTAADNVSKIGEQIEYITGEVDSLTEEAGKMAEAEQESEVIIHELNASNEETISSITNVAEQINVTNASIKRIRKAATMIQSISEETDLLSLNASIEAARAGEAGKGFAVVAEQICKLADQSNSAAEQIEEIIKGVTAESSKMVEIMEVVKDNVDEQQRKLEETKNKFNAVAVGVETSRTNIEGIRQKMEVLGDSSDTIMGVVENLAAISEKNAESTEDTMASARDMTATMEELESASAKLRELSSRLDQSLEIFKM